MADLDSRAKRASAIAFDMRWGHIFPNPDGALDQADRQQIAYKYPGILAASVSTVRVNVYRTIMGIGG